MRLWIDVWNLKPGEDVQSALEEALRAAPVLAVRAGQGAVGQAEFQKPPGEATTEERQVLQALRERLPRTMISSVEKALRALAVEG